MARCSLSPFVVAAALLCSGSAAGSCIVVEPSAVVRLEPPQGSPEFPRYLVALEVPGALEGATIDYARLTLGAEVASSASPAPFIVGVYAVTTAWSALSVAWDAPWAAPGGDFDEHSHAAHVGLASEHARVSLDVTGIVQGWADGEAANYGLLVLTPAGAGHAIGAVSEAPAPAIEIWYTAAAQASPGQ